MYLYVQENGYKNEDFEIVTNFPRKVIDMTNSDDTTLIDAKLHPQETVFVHMPWKYWLFLNPHAPGIIAIKSILINVFRNLSCIVLCNYKYAEGYLNACICHLYPHIWSKCFTIKAEAWVQRGGVPREGKHLDGVREN